MKNNPKKLSQVIFLTLGLLTPQYIIAQTNQPTQPNQADQPDQPPQQKQLPNPTQLNQFATYLEKNAPPDSTQSIEAISALAEKTYYVVISNEGESAVANLYAQSPDGKARRIGSEENVDKLIIKTLPKETAQDLISQLAQEEVRTQGKTKIEDGIKQLLKLSGASGLNTISEERLQAYKKLGVKIPSVTNQ